jgi:ABC-type polysaccharide/polyol phosphate export permease
MTHFGVFVEDLTNVITVVLQLGFYVSGVFYSLETRLSKANLEISFIEKIPFFETSKEVWSFVGNVLTNFNPLALIMSDMRYAVLGNGEGIHYVALLAWTIISVIVSIIGIKVIYKFENSYVKII